MRIVSRTAKPIAGGYESVYVNFSSSGSLINFIDGGVTLPGEYAEKSDNEIIQHLLTLLAKQFFPEQVEPSLVKQYAQLDKLISVLTPNANTIKDKTKALNKIVDRTTRNNDKLVMALLLNILDANTINDNYDIIIDTFDEYEINYDYSAGDKFKFKGKLYEVIVEHTSNVEWIPDLENSKYREIILKREKLGRKETIEDEANRYITKSQLDKAIASIVTMLTSLEEYEDDETNSNDSNEDNEGGVQND